MLFQRYPHFKHGQIGGIGQTGRIRQIGTGQTHCRASLRQTHCRASLLRQTHCRASLPPPDALPCVPTSAKRTAVRRYLRQTHCRASLPCVSTSITPSLRRSISPHSLTHSLPHSFTPSLPPSLTPSQIPASPSNAAWPLFVTAARGSRWQMYHSPSFAREQSAPTSRRAGTRR